MPLHRCVSVRHCLSVHLSVNKVRLTKYFTDLLLVCRSAPLETACDLSNIEASTSGCAIHQVPRLNKQQVGGKAN